MSAVDRSDLIEDIEWLIATGETHPETLARRAGWTGTFEALDRYLRRAHRADLIRHFQHAVAAERWERERRRPSPAEITAGEANRLLTRLRVARIDPEHVTEWRRSALESALCGWKVSA